jgi:hypothetical protein
MRKLILLLLLVSLLETATAQKQGLEGQVFWLSGNQMPGPDKKRNPDQGISREVYIYNATALTDATQDGTFYSDIKTAFVTRFTTNPDGTFKVKLPPGKYSVFVKEQKGLFANLFDGNGCINCVVVKPKKYTWITITVDYEAAY